MDTVSTWTLDAFVSAGGETAETTLNVTIEDVPPEPGIGHFEHGMAIGPVFLVLHPVLLTLLNTYHGEQFTVGINGRSAVVEFDFSMFMIRRNAAELLVESDELNTEIAAYIAETQQTLVR